MRGFQRTQPRSKDYSNESTHRCSQPYPPLGGSPGKARLRSTSSSTWRHPPARPGGGVDPRRAAVQTTGQTARGQGVEGGQATHPPAGRSPNGKVPGGKTTHTGPDGNASMRVCETVSEGLIWSQPMAREKTGDVTHPLFHPGAP